MRKSAITLAALCLASSALIQNLGYSQGGSNPLSKLEGKPAPAFKMTTTDGKTLTNANLKGKVVLLDFWATWCGPCKAASPTMQKLHEKFASQGLVVVGANTMDGKDGKQKSIRYAKEHKYTYPFTFGNDALSTKMGVRAIPAFIWIGRDGKVAKASLGFSTASAPSFEATAKTLLAKK